MTEDMNYDKGDHYSNSMSDAHPGVQVAGDVLPMPGDRTPGSEYKGMDPNSIEYATGTKRDPKVLSIGPKTLGGWANRTSTRIDGR